MFRRRRRGWQACHFFHWLLNSVSPLSSSSSPLLFFFLHIIFRLVSFRPGGVAPPHTVPGWCGQGVPIHSQAAAAPPPGAHAVSAPAAERTGPAAPGDPAAAPAVSGEAQAAVPAAAAAPQQGGSAQLPSGAAPPSPSRMPDAVLSSSASAPLLTLSGQNGEGRTRSPCCAVWSRA